MIYTSYFANYRNFPTLCIPVSIARYLPGHIKYMKELKLLAPSESLLSEYKKGKLKDRDYALMYFDELRSKIEDVRAVLMQLDYYDRYILLCYEKKGDFCHRHLLEIFVNEYLPELSIEFKEL
jgi:uncharacterized protein YeaO (DUF488 family)